LKRALDSGTVSVFVTRQPCILASAKIRAYEKAITETETAVES